MKHEFNSETLGVYSHFNERWFILNERLMHSCLCTEMRIRSKLLKLESYE